MELQTFDEIITERGDVAVFGDLHLANSVQIGEYQALTEKHNGPTIQIGDFSMDERTHEWWAQWACKGIHAVLGGNHDHWPSIHNNVHSLGDFGILKKSNIMFVRGAETPDFNFIRNPKKPRINWWEQEEITDEQMEKARELYFAEKPRIMITHDTADIVRKKVHNISKTSRTSDFLQTLFEAHKPDLWLYGHHHKASEESIEGCKFICVESWGKRIIKIT